MINAFRSSLTALVLGTLLYGFIFPTVVWGVGRLFFAEQAGGSKIYRDQKLVGSSLLGQNFTQEKYFWPRFSASPAGPYQFVGATAANAYLTDAGYAKNIEQRSAAWGAAHKGDGPPPVLLTSSASGLDPHITPESAAYQAERVARARRMDMLKIMSIIEQHTQKPTFGFIGEKRVNVLLLNLALDAAQEKSP